MTDNQVLAQNLKIFSLVRLKADCKIVPVRADFTTPHMPNTPPTSIVPTYNQDAAFYTPAFLLSTDKKYYQENATFQKCQFEERANRCLQETASSSHASPPSDLPAPAPTSDYCQICQQRFLDYFAHINLRLHRLRVSHAEASLMISELCHQFTDTASPLNPPKNKPIRKDTRKDQKPPTRRPQNKKDYSQAEQQVQKGQNISTGLLSESPSYSE